MRPWVLGVLFLTFLGGHWTSAAAQEKGKVVIGMGLDAFRRVYPGVVPVDAKPDGQWSRPETLAGLPGRWSYTFVAGRLDWALWNVYVDELTESSFARCLKGARALIAIYTKAYGRPLSSEELDTVFKDPMKHHHWGYEVLFAKWQLDDLKFKIAFRFMGGKGEYHLIVSMAFFRSDYPYFE